MKQEKIDPARLVPLDLFTGDAPLRVDLVYTRPDAFCGAVYRPGARLWLHEDLAALTLLAARLAGKRHKLRLVAYDGLRTVSAQNLMLESPAVRAHPQWLVAETRVLSPPGGGGHPRGMAVDVSLETADGVLLDMGTAFDELPEGGNGPAANRAHRQHPGLPDDVRANRALLESAMMDAAARLGLPLLPLPVEWWDFRFPAEVSGAFAPLDDPDLPPQMRMTGLHLNADGPADFGAEHFEKVKAALLRRVNF